MGIDIEGTCPYDKFKAVKRYTTKILYGYSKINMGDSCLKIKKGDSKLFRPNSTHEEKST